MRTADYFLISVLLLAACNPAAEDDNSSANNKQESVKAWHKISVKKQILEKSISMVQYGDCDEDALEDTIHEFYIPYINYSEMSDSSLFVDFRMIDNCCMHHSGLYTIENDTLYFDIKWSGQLCDCLCWYRYKLSISNIHKHFSAFKLVY